ncbi:DUF3841 domain-containing protein [Clostridium formicaceticum]|uniref:DUF3841 domain-containing protein n=1 Tax=Clostridium formicaceticum TaxID=1497 RepID=A0AAC9RMV2_9CLOT|nr:DUF3841 domain-containing protein [Clostridium formicaceticum]AOY76734.1 hypothetical protein BJL90_13165 [Clostridium formicaceticum]ARE87170.1 hypothetical protein CLFO_15580 [Clostridium formicaceticum]
MKLWTIQNIAAYEKFKETGVLRAEEEFIWNDFKFQYNWIVGQMKNRIGSPLDKKIKFPIWAWHQWSGVKKPKPDLRFSGHLEKGTKGARIEFEASNKSFLLSDFHGFNCILNYGYICDYEMEYDNFYERLAQYGYVHESMFNLNEQSETMGFFRDELIRSWEKIFDLDVNDEYWSGKKEEQSIQATLWEVKWEQVISVKEFMAK